MQQNKWVLKAKRKDALNIDLRMICLPYAGGGASTYLNWSEWLPNNVELLAIQPPGRASRFLEPAHTNMETLVEDLLSNLVNDLEQPYIIFGHSLGSRVAFELTLRCKQLNLKMPSHFIASGSRAPHLPPRKKAIYQLSDDEFISELKKINGTPNEVSSNRELMELFLPLLRADFKLADTYCYTKKTILDCPVSVFSGVEDTDITMSDLKSWQDFFSEPIEIKYLPGDHFFIETEKASVQQNVMSIVQNLLAKQRE